MSAPWLLSASQVSTFELCERKWGWTYLEDLRPLPNASAQGGIDGHEYLEESVALRFWDTRNPIYQLVKPALPVLEKVPVDADIEHEFRIELGPSPEGRTHTFRGYIDLTWLADLPVVWDHKFVGSMKYAKTPEDLIRDVQATLYCAAAWDRYYQGEPGAVLLHWQYYQTKNGTGAKSTKVKALPEEVKPRLHQTLISADKIVAAKEANKRAGDMSPNWDACWAFGGCPFRSHCEAEEKSKGSGIEMENKRESLMAMILNKAKAQPSVAVVEVPLSSVVAINPPAAPDVEPPFNCPEPVVSVTNGPTPEPAKADAPAPKQKRRTKTTLYVNCTPTLGAKAPTNASVLLEKARTKIDARHYT